MRCGLRASKSEATPSPPTSAGVADTSGDGLLPSTGTATLTVTKGNQTAPTAPTMSSRTTNSVTLNAISSIGQGAVQYGYVQGGSGTPNNWQDGTTFTGLSAGTTYTFYARYAGNDYYEPSPVSTGTGIVTLGAEGGDTLADGETITTGDGTTIKNDGEKIIITPRWRFSNGHHTCRQRNRQHRRGYCKCPRRLHCDHRRWPEHHRW